MEDFISRFSDSLILKHTKTFFSNEESKEDSNPIFKNPKPNPNPNEKPTFPRRFLFHIFRSIHSLTISYIYPDYITLCDNVIKHRHSLDTQTRYLHTFLLQLPRNKGENDHDLDLFIKQYRECYAEIETEMECLVTQIRIFEKKLKLDLMFMDLKLMDTGDKARMEALLGAINTYRRNRRKKLMLLLAEKTAYEFRFLGLKGLISNDVGAFNFAYDARVLHKWGFDDASTCAFLIAIDRFNFGKSSKPLRFHQLSRDGVDRLDWGNSSRPFLFRELSKDSK